MDDTRDLKADEYLFKEGDPSDGCIYVVNTGKLSVSKNGAHLGELGQGDFVGEMSLLIGELSARGATVRAIEDCRVLVLDDERFLSSIQRTPTLALKIMKTLARRLQSANENLAKAGIDPEPGSSETP